MLRQDLLMSAVRRGLGPTPSPFERGRHSTMKDNAENYTAQTEERKARSTERNYESVVGLQLSGGQQRARGRQVYGEDIPELEAGRLVADKIGRVSSAGQDGLKRPKAAVAVPGIPAQPQVYNFMEGWTWQEVGEAVLLQVEETEAV